MPQLGKASPMSKHVCKHSWINRVDVVEIAQSQAIILAMMEHLSNCVHFSNCHR